MYGVGGERSLVEEELDHLSGLRRRRARCASATAPTTRGSTTSGAPCSTRSTCTPSRASRSPRRCGRCSRSRSRRRSSTGASPTAASGRCAASRSTSPRQQDHVLGRARPRRRSWPSCEGEKSYAAAVAGDRRGDQGRHPRHTASTSAACSPSATATTRWTRRCCWLPLMRFLPPDDPRIRATVLAIADELTEDGLVLRYRVEETDDGLSGEEGTFTICSFWLVSALVEIGEVAPGPAPVRAAAVLRQPAAPLRRGDRPAHRPAPGQLPAGVHPPGADQRRGARDPRRAGSRQLRELPAGQRAGLIRPNTVRSRCRIMVRRYLCRCSPVGPPSQHGLSPPSI